MSDTVFQNSGCVNTILGAYNMLNAFLPLQYYASVETTLNAKFRRFPNQQPTSLPKLSYFGVGIQGYYNSGESDHRKYNPDPRNMNLYSPVPIRMVPIENDLTPTERELYRLRVEETFGTQKYACYYLKKILWDPAYVQLIQKGADGTETQYNLNPGDFMTPTPVKATTGGRMTTDDARVIVRAVGKCTVTLKELSEAASVKYGRDYFIVSEWGYYTGCDCYVTSDEELIGDVTQIARPGNAANVEAVYVQLAKHKTELPLTLSSTESELTSWVSFESPEAIEV